jgi:thymidine kinase
MKLSVNGRLDVICGPMFSGKTEELIRLMRRAGIANLNIQTFKHCFDNRVTADNLHSHSGEEIESAAVSTAEHLKMLLMPDTQVIGIDEVQFFSDDIVDLIQDLVASEKHVIVAGLDLDFRGVPFSCMPTLLAIADTVIKLNAVCMICGHDAHFSQRLINGKPAKFNDPIVMVGSEERYQARCRQCFEINQEAVKAEIRNVMKKQHEKTV